MQRCGTGDAAVWFYGRVNNILSQTVIIFGQENRETTEGNYAITIS